MLHGRGADTQHYNEAFSRKVLFENQRQQLVFAFN